MRCFLLLLLPILLLACRKDPDLHVDTTIEIRDPEVSIASDSSRDVSVTVVFTQYGNYFHTDAHIMAYDFKARTDTLALYRTQLPTAREFVKWNFKLPKGGFYMIEAGLYSGGSGELSDMDFTFPEVRKLSTQVTNIVDKILTKTITL